MRYLLIPACMLAFVALSACGSPPVVEVERKSAFEPVDVTERKVSLEPPDYTRDWRSIADKGFKLEYEAYVTQILWRRRNWNMTLTDEWVDDLVADMQRRFRWDKKLADWVAEKGNPEWPR